MYDPFQSYQTSGPYYGIQSPIGSPFAAVQPQLTAAAAVNPLAAILASQAAQQAYGGLPIQNLLGQQFASAIAPQAGSQQLAGIAPLIAAFHNPISNAVGLGGLQNALIANPLLAAALAQQVAQQAYSPYAQLLHSSFPFGQPVSAIGQIGSPLAQAGVPLPQTWVGQGGQQTGQVFGQQPQFGQQLQPFFSQFGGRPLQAPGISPWGW